MTLATGSTKGIYHPTAQKVCELYNSTKKNTDISCHIHNGKGSAHNLEELKDQSFDLAIAHSYWVKNSYYGEKYRFKGVSNPKLRALASFYSESLTIIAKENKNIDTLDDLVGKKIDLGSANTLSRDLVNHLMAVKGWTPDSFKAPSEIKSGQGKKDAFCENKVDAVFYEVGHPSNYVRKMLQECNGKLLALKADTIERLISRDASLSTAQIPYQNYKPGTKSISSVAHRPLLVTTDDLTDNIAYLFTKSVIENIDELKNVFPAFQALHKNKMAFDSIAIPLHNGAKKYFDEKHISY